MRNRFIAILAVSAFALAMAACENGEQNDAPEAQTPEGMERVDTERVSVAVPEELQEDDAPADSLWGHIYQDEAATAQVAISVPLEGYTARMATNVYIDVIGDAVDGFRPVAPEDRPEWEQDTDEEDLNLFHRSRFTYDGYEVVLWSLAGPEREAVLVQYVSTSIDEDLAQAIEQSIDLAEADAAPDTENEGS